MIIPRITTPAIRQTCASIRSLASASDACCSCVGSTIRYRKFRYQTCFLKCLAEIFAGAPAAARKQPRERRISSPAWAQRTPVCSSSRARFARRSSCRWRSRSRSWSIDSKQMALFAAFGSMSLLVFVDFGGARPCAPACLPAAARGRRGADRARHALLAVELAGDVAMGLVAFAILFAGVLDDYIAASHAAAMLTFVLGVMVPADGRPRSPRGWPAGGSRERSAFPRRCCCGPARPRERSATKPRRRRARSPSWCRRARAVMTRRGHARRGTRTRATLALRDRFVSMAQRPSGTSGSTAALARLIEDLGWLGRVAARVPALGEQGQRPLRRRARRDRGGGPGRVARVGGQARSGSIRSEETLDLTRLRAAHEAFGVPSWRTSKACGPIATRPRRRASWTTPTACASSPTGRSWSAATPCRPATARRCVRRARSPARAGPRPRPRSRPHRSRRRAGGAARSSRELGVAAQQRARGGRPGARGARRPADRPAARLLDRARDMSVLRSSAVATSATIVWALLGTLAGIVVGGLIVIVLGGTAGALWAVLPFAVLLAAYAPGDLLRGRSGRLHGRGARALQPDPADRLEGGLVRVEDIAIGAAVSLLVGVLIWPRGATAILRGAIGAAYVEAARYLDAAIAALLGDGEQGAAGEAARAAFDAAQLLDTAVRDYLASRSFARGRLHDLTVLSTGAGRVRRVARLLQVRRADPPRADRRGGAPARTRARRLRGAAAGALRMVSVARPGDLASGSPRARRRARTPGPASATGPGARPFLIGRGRPSRGSRSLGRSATWRCWPHSSRCSPARRGVSTMTPIRAGRTARTARGARSPRRRIRPPRCCAERACRGLLSALAAEDDALEPEQAERTGLALLAGDADLDHDRFAVGPRRAVGGGEVPFGSRLPGAVRRVCPGSIAAPVPPCSTEQEPVSWSASSSSQ